jgi:hypothetical protein
MKALLIGEDMAVFGESEKWSCSNPIIEADLNALTERAATQYSTGDGTRREFLFMQAAEAYEGVAKFDDEEPEPMLKGVIY